MLIARRNLMGGGAKLPYDAEVEYIRPIVTNAFIAGPAWDCSLVPFEVEWYTFNDEGFSNAVSARDVNSAGAGYGIGSAGTAIGGVYQISLDNGESRVLLNTRVSAGHYVKVLADGAVFSCYVDGVLSSSTAYSKRTVKGSRRMNLVGNNNVGVYGSTRSRRYMHVVIGDGYDCIPVRITNEEGEREGAYYNRATGEILRANVRNAFEIGSDKVGTAFDGGGINV